jgi:hypothetical protein
MHTLGYIAKSLNRSALYLTGLQDRFKLPAIKGPEYSDAYLAFLRIVVHLRILNISEESLRDLWLFEKKLLQLLYVDSTGSPTWFLDSCGQTDRPRQRLLLSNYDLGAELPTGTLQLGLNFATDLPELFAGKDMGEDALRVLRDYLKRYTKIQTKLNAELPLVREATRWSKRLKY